MNFSEENISGFFSRQWTSIATNMLKQFQKATGFLTTIVCLVLVCDTPGNTISWMAVG